MKKLKTILQSNYIYIILSLITLLYVYYYININHNSKYNLSDTIFEGYIYDIDITDEKAVIELVGKEKLLVNYYIKTNEEYNYILENYELGDYLYIVGEVIIPNSNTNFNTFNYKNYLLSKKIYSIISASEIKLIRKNNNILYFIKNILLEKINNMKSNKYLNLFILGKNNLNEDVISSYRQNGISHLLAISGMHITLFTSILLKLLNKLLKREKPVYFIIFIFLLFYIFLTNFSLSVIRSSLLFVLICINKMLNLKIKNSNILIIIGLCMIINNPYYIYNISFLFSFVISFYLILFSNIINKYKNYFVKIFMTSLISFLVSMPIIINNFYEINLLSPIINIIMLPIISVIIFPLSLLTLFIPFLDNILFALTNVFENISLTISNIKMFNIIIPKLTTIIIIIYYIWITLILSKFYIKKYTLILLLVLIIFYSNINYFHNYFRITMLDVGQGDSSLIALPYNSSNILIDTGGKLSYDNKQKNYIVSNITIVYLKSIGVKKLDYLILTHGDFDHMGEAISLVENFKVENVIFNCGEYNDLEQKLISVLDKKKIKHYSCIKELNIDKYKLHFLNTKEYDNENDNSNVIYFNYNDYKFLFMGDAGVEKENDILEKYNLKDIDFLKVGHHGSNTSSSEYFIDKINPKFSLISVGKNNRYGHPKEEVLDTLRNSKIYRTDIDGSIEIKLNKSGYKIRTCPP